MANVMIYTTNDCPYCNAAKRLLQSKNVTFEEINIENDDQKRKWLQETTGQRTVPQIFINDQSVGGFEELAKLDREGKLEKLLSETGF